MISQRQLFLHHVAQTSDAPMMLEIDRAEGCFLFDTEGVAYLDLIAGISVSVLGHRHPNVQRAIEKQVGKYWHTLVYGEFVLSPQVELATLLSQLLPDNLDSVYFTNSGTEATEGAMKLVKRATGRSEIIAMKNAYHGSTQGAMSLNSDTYFTQAYRPLLPDIQHITFNCETCLREITTRTAAVIVETVQAESGIYAPDEGYLKALRQRCTDVGTLLILDEIQAGMGRTGTLWAFEQHGITPDILLLAKGLGGGMPIGAFIASKELMWSLTNNPVLGHITTFGGHPVSCAAAFATLKTLVESDLIAQVKAKEALFLKLLVHRHIRAVRSVGLWLAVELKDFDAIQQVIKSCLSAGLITDWFLFNSSSLRIAPPLTISEPEIEWACRVILKALDKL
ncbi:MAG: aminotransferase class III-fold pyridoxal phosphate-dependent enzyme [Saprospiraceae bacterium]|nr:aminotransferase class III-fold pyridoxal phosphate-dependent enzyme [Saprospiraceae bacterium]